MAELNSKDLERIAKMAICLGQQGGQPKNTVVFDKKFLELYDNVELAVEDLGNSIRIRHSMK